VRAEEGRTQKRAQAGAERSSESSWEEFWFVHLLLSKRIPSILFDRGAARAFTRLFTPMPGSILRFFLGGVPRLAQSLRFEILLLIWRFDRGSRPLLEPRPLKDSSRTSSLFTYLLRREPRWTRSSDGYRDEPHPRPFLLLVDCQRLTSQRRSWIAWGLTCNHPEGSAAA